jgi:hypothetical protein
MGADRWLRHWYETGENSDDNWRNRFVRVVVGCGIV